MFLRRNKVKEYLLKHNLDALLISNFYNILYLTNFKTLTTDEREAFVLVTKKNTYLFTDGRYLFADPDISMRLIEPSRGLIVRLGEVIKEEGLKKIGFESEDVSYFEYDKISRKLLNASFIPQENPLVHLRECKEENEVGKIKKACQVGDDCLQDIARWIKVGMTEKEVAFKIEFWLKEKGYDTAFDPIVAVDVNSSIPHYNTGAGSGIIKRNSVVLIDFGARVQDYLSDITRMIFMKEVPQSVIDVYKKLSDTQSEAIKKIRSSSKLKEIDIFCRESLKKHKFPEFPHSTGHGVGLEIHEYPKVSFNAEDQKKNGQVITVEPGIYFIGKLGMRVEDTVVIRENVGLPLTSFPKEPLVLS